MTILRLPSFVRSRLAIAALFAGLLLSAASARAGSVEDLTAPWPGSVGPVRALSMGGAGTALSTGNEAVFLNPAGIGLSRHYQLEVDGLLDRKFPAQGVFVSVVDSVSSEVPAGLSFARFGSGQPEGRGEGWFGGLSYGYSAGPFAFGGTTHYLHFETPDGRVRDFTQDLGILLRRGGFAWGATIRNLTGHVVPLFHPTATGGITYGSDQSWNLAIDYVADLSDTAHLRQRVNTGVEVLAGGFPLRAGYSYALTPASQPGDVDRKESWLSLGTGFLTELGSVQGGYRRRVSGGSLSQSFELGLTLFLE